MDDKYNYFIQSNIIYMIITAVLIGTLLFYDHNIIGFTALALFVVLIIYNIKSSGVKRHKWRIFIEEFSSQLDVATRSTLVKFPFPLIIMGNKGNILWYNQNAINMMEGTDILGKNIEDIFKDVDINEIIAGEKNIFQYVKVKNKYYDIYTSKVDTGTIKDKDNINLLYFYEVSDKINMLNEIKDNKEALILMEVDNLDEVIKTTEEDKKPLLMAEIERSINSYGQSINAMLKKYSSSKYIICAQNKYIIKEMEKRFEILDAVRELDIGNKLAVTLSMGIGIGGNSPLENYKYAVSAKELALGRGGDQAVIKNKDKLSFYGGKTKEIEKRTKVRARIVAQSLVDLINESTNIFIMGHMNSDIDCLGAAIGIYSAAKRINKECYVILDNVNTTIENMVYKFKQDKDYTDVFIESKKSEEMINNNSLLILVDVNSKSYVQSEDILNNIKRVVIIDHHRKAANFIEDTLLSYIEPYASSSSELVTEMIQYMDDTPKLKVIEAEALLAGICVDTKNFCFKTGVRTFEAAAFLRKLGADTIVIKELFSSNLEDYTKKSEIIKSAKVENNIAIAFCPLDIENNVLAAQAADELLNITGIQASFVFVKIKEDIVISARSLGKINVQIILEGFGGGGHMTIAGARLSSLTMEEAVLKLKEAIDKYLKEGE